MIAKVFWFLSLLSTIVACIATIAMVHDAQSAPQEAAAAAMGLAIAILPYCFARAIEGMARPSKESQE